MQIQQNNSLIYNTLTKKLSSFIPIKSTRRKLRNHIQYKLEHPKVTNYLSNNYINPFLEGKIPHFDFEKNIILKTIKLFGNFGIKVKIKLHL